MGRWGDGAVYHGQCVMGSGQLAVGKGLLHLIGLGLFVCRHHGWLSVRTDQDFGALRNRGLWPQQQQRPASSATCIATCITVGIGIIVVACTSVVTTVVTSSAVTSTSF